MILSKIARVKREEVDDCRRHLPLSQICRKVADSPPVRCFDRAVQRDGHTLHLIAEIKRASPSAGIIRAHFSPEEIAVSYEKSGARAISVLTDTVFFQGDPSYLGRVRQVSGLPILRKDFIIDSYQVYQSRLLGADAILLIAALLERQQLAEYLGLAGELGMAALVEVHTTDELEGVVETGARLIGINNRDLHTFQVDLNTTCALASCIPPERVVVSESGITTAADMKKLAATRVDAVLVGTVLMSSPDPGAALSSLLRETV